MKQSTFLTLNTIVNNLIHFFSYEKNFDLVNDGTVSFILGSRCVNLDNQEINILIEIDTVKEQVLLEPALNSDLDCNKQIYLSHWDREQVSDFFINFVKYATGKDPNLLLL